MTADWRPEGAARDAAIVAADGRPVAGIHDVVVHEVRNIPKANGRLTEIFRRDWFPEGAVVDQVFQVLLEPRAVSAWHAHESAVDRVFVTRGTVRVVLYDGRPGSPSLGQVTELIAEPSRPRLIVIPPRVWHGVQNLSRRRAVLLNMPDQAYKYDAPDHWRLPADTDAIPYRFAPA